MSTRLILIRHGETDYSLDRRYCGFTDVCLNKRGIKQAEELCQRLSREKIDKVYSSDLKRTREFASIIFKDREIEIIPELREMDFGIFEGLRHEEIMKTHADVYKKWLRDPLNTLIPKGDSLVDFKERIEEVVERIVSLNKDKILAIVTHAGPIKVIMNNITKSENIWGINPELGSFRSCVYE